MLSSQRKDLLKGAVSDLKLAPVDETHHHLVVQQIAVGLRVDEMSAWRHHQDEIETGLPRAGDEMIIEIVEEVTEIDQEAALLLIVDLSMTVVITVETAGRRHPMDGLDTRDPQATPTLIETFIALKDEITVEIETATETLETETLETETGTET